MLKRNLELDIVYIDDDIVVINKQPGIATHSSLSFDGRDLVELLLYKKIKIKTSGDKDRQGVVSRLDVGTSGLIVFARNEESFQKLKEMFQNRQVKKTYYALVEGAFKIKSATIDAKIGRHPNPKKRALYAVVDDGKEAITNYDVEEEYKFKKETLSFLKIGLETGRTHQIRVHMSHYNHPLVGDINYGANKELREQLQLTRQFLHSGNLAFKHPISGKELQFCAPLHDDLLNAIKILSK